ncbi:protein IQ-domain 14-like, partial [Trifolium medium]|nr:protein IQ-domain 14-like [Trifolium medium]
TAPPRTSKETEPNEAEKEKTKHSESAVSATEVVILGGVSSQDNSAESETSKTVNGVSQSIYQCQKVIQEFAAIKIQTAFRGYLVSLFA